MRRHGNWKANKVGTGLGLGPLWKTVLCREFPHGRCRFSAKDCSFAHGDDDLRPSPDMTRTSVCPTWMRNGECKNPECRYAHDSTELRQDKRILKTQLCKFFRSSEGCILGKACRFAHGTHELCKTQADVNRQQRREAFLKSGSLSVAGAAEPVQMIRPPVSQQCAFVPTLVWRQMPVFVPVEQLHGLGASFRSMSADGRCHQGIRTTFVSRNLQRRRSSGFKARQSPNDASPTAHTNVERIRAAMSTNINIAAALASTTIELESTTVSPDPDIMRQRIAIRNTFVDIESTPPEPPARSKSV